MRSMSLGRLVEVITLSILVVQCPTLTTSADITIGGLFDAFSYTENGSLTKNDKECQHLAAFMMAVDEINRKNDGIYDNLLPNNNEVKMAINPGQSVARLYPANPYYDGTASVYQIYQSSPSVIATVETNSDLAKVTASASSLNSFGSVAMLSSSPSSVFNDALVYPMTLQIAPTTMSEAVSILKLMSKLQWKNVVIFPSTDIAGIDSFANFLGSVPDISILGVYYFSRGTVDFSPQITAAKATGAKIFIFFLEGSIAGMLLEQGYEAGLFQDGTQIIATSTSNIDDIRGAFSPAGKLNEENILKGFMSTAPYPSYYFGTPQGQSFISRFRKLPPTIRVDPITKAKTCSSRTVVSSNGSYNIRQRTNNHTFYDATDKLCLGFESFEAFNQSGDNLDPNIMFTYDAVYTYLIAAGGLERSGVPLTAERLFTYMVSNFYPSLVTGQAVFLPGRGTRSMGNVFKLLNYQSNAKVSKHSVGGLAFVGEYTDAFGWLLCDSEDTVHMINSSRTACSQPLYRLTPSSTRPSDAPPPILGRLPDSFKAILITFSSFGLCTLAVWTVFLIMFWNAKPIRRGQPRLMAVLLLGGLMGLVKVFLSAADVTQASCITQLWFSHFGFRLIFRTLLLKVWRINAVVNARGFKRVIIAESTVFWFLCCDIVFTSLFLLMPITILSYVNQGMVGYVTDNIKNQIYNYPECQVSLTRGVRILNAILYASDGLILVMAMHYTFLTRKVPASVNETTTVAPAILGTVASIVVASVVTYTTPLDTKWRTLLLNSAFLLVIILSNGLYFGSKAMDIYAARRAGKYAHRTTRNIEQTFLDLVRAGYRYGSDSCSPKQDEENSLHELALLIGMLKKAPTPEAKLRMCSNQVTGWRNMLMLVSDGLTGIEEEDSEPTPCSIIYGRVHDGEKG